ncbi:hypothetical protein AAGW05_11105 [Arthrobacter sp. LAPM80]|uniref:hypothetical protein n=1 Tax=Arthrobacter sp. LAPM80 TaxID=3141788 RepID=UPI00398B822F
MEKFFGADGGQTSGILDGLKFVAEKFGWDLSLADSEFASSGFNETVKIGGRVLGALGVIMGGLDNSSGIENKDPFRLAGRWARFRIIPAHRNSFPAPTYASPATKFWRS